MTFGATLSFGGGGGGVLRLFVGICIGVGVRIGMGFLVRTVGDKAAGADVPERGDGVVGEVGE
jgi:hypothetical protein